jgi:hypothetical protein
MDLVVRIQPLKDDLKYLLLSITMSFNIKNETDFPIKYLVAVEEDLEHADVAPGQSEISALQWNGDTLEFEDKSTGRVMRATKEVDLPANGVCNMEVHQVQGRTL